MVKTQLCVPEGRANDPSRAHPRLCFTTSSLLQLGVSFCVEDMEAAMLKRKPVARKPSCSIRDPRLCGLALTLQLHKWLWLFALTMVVLGLEPCLGRVSLCFLGLAFLRRLRRRLPANHSAGRIRSSLRR